MKLRKAIALLAAALMIAGFPAAAFADGNFGDNTAQRDRDISGDAPFILDGDNNDSNITSDSVNGVELAPLPKGKPIPVYGYVGPDAVIVDRDPNNPYAKPDYIEYEINVSVPVKILWAAFENGSVSPSSSPGDVVSPNYYIRNNSAVSVKVQVYDFDPTGTDNTSVDSNLTLNIVGDISHTGLWNGTVFTATPTVFTEIASGVKSGFKITGTYTGGFTTAYQPQYALQFKFDLVSA